MWVVWREKENTTRATAVLPSQTLTQSSPLLLPLTSDLDFVFHMFFLVKYAKALEEASFRGRAADFLWMLLLGGATLAAAAPLAGVQFLGSSLAFMMVYVWSRRNRHVALSFLGIVTFTAPYLPWVLLALSTLLRSSAAVDVLGLGAGECFFFLGGQRGESGATF